METPLLPREIASHGPERVDVWAASIPLTRAKPYIKRLTKRSGNGALPGLVVPKQDAAEGGEPEEDELDFSD